RVADAVAAFRRAVAGAPRDPEFHYMLGVAADRSGDRAAAATAFRRALDLGLTERDAAQARTWLAARAARPPRLTVETQVGGGYDSHYASGREALFMTGSRPAGAGTGAPELVLDVEPRLPLAGSGDRSLVAGDHLSALLYLESAADPYSLVEDDLYLEGTLSPRCWLPLAASAQVYLET